MGLAPFGTDAFLRTRLRTHLQQIKRDDYQIEKEGLENLTEEELRSVRGICEAAGGMGSCPESELRSVSNAVRSRDS